MSASKRMWGKDTILAGFVGMAATISSKRCQSVLPRDHATHSLPMAHAGQHTLPLTPDHGCQDRFVVYAV